MSACIDISHWQGFPDFEQVAREGVVACIMKATEGTSYIDPNRAANFVAATNAGIACCCYFWLKPGNGAAQADFFLEVVQPVEGERVVIDYEESGCSLTDLKQAIQALLDYGNDLRITVYSGHLLKEQLGNDFDEYLYEHTDLWLAQYTTGTPTWPSETYPDWTLWQYTDQGDVDGIDGNVDLDDFNGDNKALLEWITPAGKKPPTPQPEPTETVEVAITAPDTVKVNVTLNGAPVRRKRKLLFVRGPDT